MKISAIDIGSNSVRLMMWADGKTLYKRLNTTRLGEGIDKTGAMSPAAIIRTANAVRDFVGLASREGAQRIYAFATAAVRASSNKCEFLSSVKEIAGIDVDVISGEEEARIGLMGALGGRDGGIIDVGGASTEITLQRGGKRLYSHSLGIGTVRLSDAAGRDYSALQAIIVQRLTEYGYVPCEGLDMYAIGGTATTIASVALGLSTYDPLKIDGTRVSIDRVRTMAEEFTSMPVEEIKRVSGMEPRRADVIGGGCLLMYEIMKMLGLSSITVSERDNLEGYVLLKGVN